MSRNIYWSSPWLLRFLFVVSLLVSLGALLSELMGPAREKPVTSRIEAFAPEFEPDPLKQLPDFKESASVSERKTDFFAALLPLVIYENERILWQREQLQVAYHLLEAGELLSSEEASILEGIFTHYHLDWPAMASDWEVVFMRAYPVPADLVLVQAAKESGWGRSRFAREGQNLFGHWCFTQGCGLVPSQRSQDLTHEVRVFASVQESVSAYLRNINTHPAYYPLRELRQQLITSGTRPSGWDLAPGLIRYSERGQAYVREVMHLLNSNQKEISQVFEDVSGYISQVSGK